MATLGLGTGFTVPMSRAIPGIEVTNAGYFNPFDCPGYSRVLIRNVISYITFLPLLTKTRHFWFTPSHGGVGVMLGVEVLGLGRRTVREGSPAPALFLSPGMVGEA